MILKLRGTSLSKDAVLAISRLVSGAVDELKPEDVSIIDADSDRSLGLGHDGPTSGEGLEASLTQRLDEHTGADRGHGQDPRQRECRITTRASTEESQEKYDPSVSALLERAEDRRPGGRTALLIRGCSGSSQATYPSPKRCASGVEDLRRRVRRSLRRPKRAIRGEQDRASHRSCRRAGFSASPLRSWSMTRW